MVSIGKYARWNPQSLTLWSSTQTDQAASKRVATGGVNADVGVACSRLVAVFDGVSGVLPPWQPPDTAT